MNEWVAKLLAIANRAVREAQDENRRRGIPNVYEINGTLVWQMPDGSLSTVHPYSGEEASVPFPPQAAALKG